MRFGNLKTSLTSSDRDRIQAIGKELVDRKRNARGELKISGKPAELKSTQQYTTEFGRAIMLSWISECVSL